MIIKGIGDGVNPPVLLHVANINFNLPGKMAQQIGDLTISDVLQADANNLANKIITHLNKRTSIKSVELKSSFATIRFTALTPDSLFASTIGDSPKDRVVVDYLVNPVNPATGVEGARKKFSVSEEGWDNASAHLEVTYVANYYRACYLLAASADMQNKNPGGYYTLLKNVNDLGSLPYLAAPMGDQVVGYLEDGGFYFSNLYPIPGSVVKEIPVSTYPHLIFAHGEDVVSNRLKSLILNHHEVDLTQVEEDFRNSELGTISTGLTHVYEISFKPSVIPITERLTGHLLNKRQNLIWCFSELSRFFEMAGVINDGHINRNLRSFQDRVKKLVNSQMDVTLFPDSSPRDLEDLIIQLFPSNYKNIYKSIKQVDPNRILYSLELISGNKEEFAKFKSSMKYLSPGLILSVSYLRSSIQPVQFPNGSNSLAFTYKGFTFKLVPLTSHTADILTYSDYNQLLADDVITEYSALLNIVFWLNTETADDFLIDNGVPGQIKVITPTHLVRKYSGLSLFTGLLSAKVLQGQI